MEWNRNLFNSLLQIEKKRHNVTLKKMSIEDFVNRKEKTHTYKYEISLYIQYFE